MEVLVLITTESNKKNALRVAKLLIQNKLAACVSIKQIFSIYKWDDDIEETKEFEITIKIENRFITSSLKTILNNFEIEDLFINEPPIDEIIGRILIKKDYDI